MPLLWGMLKIMGGVHLALWSQGTTFNEFKLYLANEGDNPDSWAYVPKWHSYGNVYRRLKNKDHLKLADEFIRDVNEPQIKNSLGVIPYLIGGIILFGVIK